VQATLTRAKLGDAYSPDRFILEDMAELVEEVPLDWTHDVRMGRQP
jgi:hypothetical protein